MRAMGSVIPIPFPMGGTDRQAWMVTRMEEAMQVLKDHARFTVDASSIDGNNDIRQSLTATLIHPLPLPSLPDIPCSCR